MVRPKTRPDPNKEDPLSEPTWNLRVWAAYLRAGYTRASFARALDMRYCALDHWDIGVVKEPNLVTFARAAELVGFTMDQLWYGKTKSPTPEPEKHEPRTGADVERMLTKLDVLTTQIARLVTALQR